jgi:ArsR family metal-binding transcriptional regulator
MTLHNKLSPLLDKVNYQQQTNTLCILILVFSKILVIGGSQRISIQKSRSKVQDKEEISSLTKECKTICTNGFA